MRWRLVLLLALALTVALSSATGRRHVAATSPSPPSFVTKVPAQPSYRQIAGLAVTSAGLFVLDGLDDQVVRIDPSTPGTELRFGSQGGGVGQFNLTPGGVALAGGPNGHLFVADGLNQRVDEFDGEGAWQGSYGNLGFAPASIAVDPVGLIFLTDGAHTIARLDGDGSLQAEWGVAGSGVGQLGAAGAIAIDPDPDRDHVYVTDRVNAKVLRYNREGDFQLEFGGSGSGNGKFAAPTDVKVEASGDVWVFDSAGRVQKFDNDGAYLGQFGSAGAGDGQFGAAGGLLALDSAGNVYAADLAADRVERFSSGGAFQARFGARGQTNGLFDAPKGIAVGAGSKVYVVDSANSRVEVFSSAGAFQAAFGTAGSGNGQLQSPAGIALDAAGNVYVADTGNSRIVKFDSGGAYQAQWSAGLSHPQGVAADSCGNVYVADTEHAALKKYATDGTPDAGFSVSLASPRAVAVDAAGRIYAVSAGATPQVVVVDATGAPVRSFGSSGSGDGQLGTAPGGLAVDDQGYVYVVDSANHRVQVFDSGGAYQTQWGGRGAANGAFDAPQGVALDGSGRVYVTDGANDRYEVFSAVAGGGLGGACLQPASAVIFAASGGNYTSAVDWDAGCGTPAGDLCGGSTPAGGHTITSVEVSVENSRTGLFWNGSSFAGAVEVYLPATGTTAWSLAFGSGAFPSCDAYAVHVRAHDSVGLTESPPKSLTFVYGTTADCDGDGYTNAQEAAVGKNPNVACAVMRADVDGDGSVSVLDLAAAAAHFLETVGPANARLNQDGDASISILDLAAMASHFLQDVSTCP